MILAVDEPRPGELNGPANRPPEGEPVELSFDEIEHRLLARLQHRNQNRKRVLKHLAAFYADHRRYDQALECLQELVTLETDLEDKAACILATGAIAEKQEDLEAAVRFYREALALEPARTFTWYFILNNLAFSLNQLGRFTEGERYSRKAIEVEGGVCNAHKNLGLALVGQGRYAEAAESFVTATKVNPRDPRSLAHLKGVLQEQPALALEFQDDLSACEQAVKLAAGMRKFG